MKPTAPKIHVNLRDPHNSENLHLVSCLDPNFARGKNGEVKFLIKSRFPVSASSIYFRCPYCGRMHYWYIDERVRPEIAAIVG